MRTKTKIKARELKARLQKLLFDERLNEVYQVAAVQDGEYYRLAGDKIDDKAIREAICEVKAVYSVHLIEGYSPEQSLWETAKELLTSDKIEAVSRSMKGEAPTHESIAQAMLDTTVQIMYGAIFHLIPQSLTNIIDQGMTLIAERAVTEISNSRKKKEKEKTAEKDEEGITKQIDRLSQYYTHYVFVGLDHIPLEVKIEQLENEEIETWLKRIAFTIRLYYITVVQAYRIFIGEFENECKCLE